MNKIWSDKDEIELKENFLYYNVHQKEAVEHFRTRWYIIKSKYDSLTKIKILKKDEWTDELIKNLREKYFYYLEHKEEALEHFQKRWEHIYNKATELNITSFKKNKNCSMFLGCHVAERVLSHVFKDTQRMPINNPGFDFICNKGFKIDVKSSCMNNRRNYSFRINYNKIADYFLCIGFDNREDLNPQHIWLIKSDEIIKEKKLNEVGSLMITPNTSNLEYYSKYELNDKLKESIECCNKIKTGEISNIKINIESDIKEFIIRNKVSRDINYGDLIDDIKVEELDKLLISNNILFDLDKFVIKQLRGNDFLYH